MNPHLQTAGALARHLLAGALLEREMLDGEQVEKVLRGEKLEPLPRPRSSTDGQDESGFTQESDDNKESARDGAHAPRIAPSESPGLA